MTIAPFRSARPSRLARLSQFSQRLGLLSVLVTLATVTDQLKAIAPAFAALDLRVAIEQDVSQVMIGSSTDAVLKDASGRDVADIPAMGALMASANGGQVNVDNRTSSLFWVEPSDDGYVFIGDKWYRGRTLVVATSGGITAVNYVDLEEYLYSVVGGEMPASWPLEALKAQAVAARSYALYQRQTSANAIFDVGDTTAWQVYEGLEDETDSTRQAVSETASQVMIYNGEIIEAVFHSSSGGHTENSEDVWSSALPYLRAVPDFDQSAPVYQWIEEFSASQLRQRITGIGNIISMVPTETTESGRIIQIQITGDQGSRVMSGNELRQALNLKSSLFVAIPQYDNVASASNTTSPPSSFQISGRGFGHGLGMSQWGAYSLAQQGYSYQQIVSYYYTGAQLAQIQVEE
jgi:stage II sporulation protein D